MYVISTICGVERDLEDGAPYSPCQEGIGTALDSGDVGCHQSYITYWYIAHNAASTQ